MKPDCDGLSMWKDNENAVVRNDHAVKPDCVPHSNLCFSEPIGDTHEHASILSFLFPKKSKIPRVLDGATVDSLQRREAGMSSGGHVIVKCQISLILAMRSQDNVFGRLPVRWNVFVLGHGQRTLVVAEVRQCSLSRSVFGPSRGRILLLKPRVAP
jgi:hypothetical protein